MAVAARLRLRYAEWRTGLWFIPSLMVAAAMVLAVIMIGLSDYVPPSLAIRLPRLFGADAEGSRSMLATIAGSMATIAGVTFSITVVAVAQASSQYTSRILRSLLADRVSQVVLGMLVGTFVYCLVLIRTIRQGGDLRFVPGVGVLVAFLFAIASMAMLVYFIHHISESLQASHILARVMRETVRAVDANFDGDATDAVEDTSSEASDAPVAEWQAVPAPRSGYVQHIDVPTLAALAEAAKVSVRVEHRVGDFVVQGSPLVCLAAHVVNEIDTDAVADAVTLGAFRTIEQDVGFGLQQIVDIANKALSPGINDATTAVNAIDALGAVLARLQCRRIALANGHADRRVRLPAMSYERLIVPPIEQLRRSASRDVAVSVHLLRTLGSVGAQTPALDRRRVLAAQLALIRDGALEHVTLNEDRAQLTKAFADAVVALRPPA